MARLKRANVALQEENHELKQREDGDRFKPTDTAKDIAAALVGTFSPSKAGEIAKQMLALLKARREQPAPRLPNTPGIEWGPPGEFERSLAKAKAR
jgi:hypothetical protein